jgi:hypothetical protein
MRKFALILGFFCTVSLPVYSETFTVEFGSLPGGLQFQFEINESDKTVSGTIRNTSPVPIGCNRLYFGSTEFQDKSGDDLRPNLDPGASRSFKWTTAARPKIRQDDCHTALSPEFKNQSEIKKFQWGTITCTPTSTGIALSLENDSDQPIEIDWNESSFIDFDHSAKTIVPGMFSPFNPIPLIPNSVAPPRARLKESITPKENYRRTGMGTSRKPLIPTSTDPGSAEKTIRDYVGKKMSLVVQLIVEGKKMPVAFEFEVKSVKAIKPNLMPIGFMFM